MTASTMLAIFIACPALFGLNGINAANRMKDISIRKVLGTSIKYLIILLNRQVIFLTMFSFHITIPISYYIMNQWLESFEYSIPITWPIFLIFCLAGILIAVLTVSYQVVRVSCQSRRDV